MTRMQDIADKLGISKGTVSKALNGTSNISKELQNKILETAVEMGYTKKFRYGKKEEQKMCILITNTEYKEPHQFAYDIILGVRKIAEPAGYMVDVVELTDKIQKSIHYDTFMLQNNYRGAFVIGLSLASPWIKEFQTSQIPAVLYDNYILGNPSIACVGIDNAEGMALAVSHLKQLGHKSIGYLSASLGSHIMQVRHKAFFQALHQSGLNADYKRARNAYLITECVEQNLPKLLKMEVTAIICSHDQLANATMLQCQQLGYHVPNDISIIGFDDLPFCAYTSPPLTTVRQNRTQIGKSAYSALENLINQISIGTLLLHAQLIVRGSTGEVNS